MGQHIPEFLCPNCRKVGPHKIIAVDRSLSLAWCENCWVPHAVPETLDELGPHREAGPARPLNPAPPHKYVWFAARRWQSGPP